MDKCIRCDGQLEKGFLIDKGDSDITRQARWASGEPSTSFWKLSAIQSDSRMLPVTTYRCQRCGRLESFANSAP
jgi:DNA-directed RNA polymerase subunit RPC12/RpoP